ncbi:MAG: sugar transferase, partial [Melioribacteraceae bacterium]|nr:sugar transferase [Melioribacteraceae bacterium]
MKDLYSFSKRIIDLLLFFILLIPAVILIASFGIILAFQFKSSPFFIQERGLTLTKHRLKILKLRTIKKDFSKVTSENDIFFKP